MLTGALHGALVPLINQLTLKGEQVLGQNSVMGCLAHVCKLLP